MKLFHTVFVAAAGLALVLSCQSPAGGAPPSQPGNKAITQFRLFPNGATPMLATIDQAAHTISAEFPHGSGAHTPSLTMLPVVTHTGVGLTPQDNQFMDFSHPVVFTVTASDGSTQSYTVTVVVDPAPKAMTNFGFADLEDAGGTVNEAAHSVAVTVPKGTDATNLAPTVTVSQGASVSPASGVPRDFSIPRVYTVTDVDGLTQDYTVTVTVDPQSGTKDITTFGFSGLSGFLGTIVGTDILIQVPHGTNVTVLIPQITHTGVSVNPVPGQATNFSQPRVFTVTAENGTSKAYTVTVQVSP